MGNILRRDDLPGDGPAICRNGYEQDISSRLVAGGITIMPDSDEKYLISFIRAIGISSDEAVRRLCRRKD